MCVLAMCFFSTTRNLKRIKQKLKKTKKASSAFAVVVNAPGGGPVVALPPSPAPPHRQNGVSVHSGSGERQGCCRDSGRGLRHLGRGRQPPLVLKPETTRSGLIYREREGGDEEERGREGGRGGEQKPN